MEFVFTRDIQSDLQDVNQAFKNSLLPWWDEIASYLEMLKQDLTFQILPAVTISAYRFVGVSEATTIAMANLFKTIYFANWIHALIKNDNEGQEYNQKLQFSILIGDYIFGRILKLLLEAGTDSLLDDFSQMMSLINEGFVIQYEENREMNEVLGKTRAPLYATAFLTAAKLANLNDEMTKLYEEIGYNLGMSLEMIHQDEGLAEVYLFKSSQLLKSFIPKETCSDKILLELMEELSNQFSNINPAAVV